MLEQRSLSLQKKYFGRMQKIIMPGLIGRYSSTQFVSIGTPFS